MMKRLLFLVLALAALASPVWGGGLLIGSGVRVVDYCATQTWATLTNFRLDFDHTTNNLTACLTSGTQLGTAVDSPSITNPTLTTTGIGSGGNALIADASGEYVVFDNNSSIFTSKWGEIIFKIKVAGDNTASYEILNIIKTSFQERLQISLATTGVISIFWEDNNDGGNTINSVDVDSYYNKWIQMHIKWDTTRCTDGTCDGAGEDELCDRYRVDNNSDGDFSDGGVEDWSSWVCENSAIDMNQWSSEPGNGSISIGLINGTYSVGVDIDDVEISNSQPSW